jgi:hypothetical protein
MQEQVFGLSLNQIMAYTAVANVAMVVVLTAINVYYAWHAKRQADASRQQVASSNRQAEIAAETLSILRRQIDQQRETDVSIVALQLRVASHTVEDWLKRIGIDGYPQLPDEIRITPADFNVATHRANAIDPVVAENMGAASLYIVEAETNLKVLRAADPTQSSQWKEMQEKAAKNLNIAKYKLNVARTRWDGLAGEKTGSKS